MSQAQELRKFLNKKNNVSENQALKKWGIKNLRAVVSDLRLNYGFEFTSKRKDDNTTYTVSYRP